MSEALGGPDNARSVAETHQGRARRGRLAASRPTFAIMAC